MNSITKFDIDKSFGKVIKEYRLKKGFTQEDLAESLEISLKYISRVENGYSGLKTETLIKCMNILGIAPNILFRDFITNQDAVEQVKICNKLSKLSPEKINFVDNMIDLLANF